MANTVIPAHTGAANPAVRLLANLNPEILRIRAALVDRIDSAAAKANQDTEPESIGMPARLMDACIYLAAQGFEAAPCEGERRFNVDTAYYRSLADADTIEAGRQAIYEGRRAIAPTLGDRLERIVQIQMEAYPSVWTDHERRDAAMDALFGREAA